MSRVVTLPPIADLLADGAKPGGWWHETDQEGRVLCDLCPRACHLKPGDRGFCFVRENRDGQMVLTTYGRSTGFCVDPIEKKPLNHFYPGTSVLSFGTAGCNLGCKFCQNWDISKSREIAKLSEEATPEAIATAAQSLGCRSVAFTYNDPVIWAEYAIDVAAACRQRGIKTVAVTAGYITEVARGPFYEAMDAANVDLKAFTEEFYHRLTLSHLQPVLDTLQWLHNETDVWIEITNLIIPDANDSSDELRLMCQWLLEHVGDKVPVHFTAFHPDFRMRDRPRTPHETLLLAYDIARQEGLLYVYVGNVHDQSRDSTYCHGCGEILIERDWHQLGAYRLRENRCSFCDTQIPGHFDSRPGDWGRRRLPVQISKFAAEVPDRAVVTTKPTQSTKSVETETNEVTLAKISDHQRRAVHQAASRFVAAAATGRKLDLPDATMAGAAPVIVQGAFVTLKRQGRLRGCCGTMGRNQRLDDAVRQAACRTATADVRLPPVSPTELPYLDLSVSLLHDFRELAAKGTVRAEQIEIGRHGLQIQREQQSGLLLPVVATEHGMTAEQFLMQVCRKAGLADDDWTRHDTRLVTFEALATDGPFDTDLFSADVLRTIELVNDVDLHRLAVHCRRNLSALLRGATPSYYLPDCPDGMIHGAAVGLSLPGESETQPSRMSQISLRPALPLQATLINLVQALAERDAAGLGASPLDGAQFQIEILDDPAMHGTLANPDLRGLDVRRRALMVQEGNRSAWIFDPQSDPDRLLATVAGRAQMTTPARASLYSLAARAYRVGSDKPAANSPKPAANSPKPAANSPPGTSLRPPAVAGRFYPADPQALATLVDELMGQESVANEAWPAAMVPHAGLIYSGRIAAAVLRRLSLPKTIIVIGPKHTPYGQRWAVSPDDGWSIPGATMAGDTELARRLVDAIDGLEFDDAAHQHEHAIEVELPLLARLAPDARVVGIAMGQADLADCRRFAGGLAEVIGQMAQPPLLLISSDMNHFATDTENRRLDELAMQALDRCDPEEVHRTVVGNGITMCGVLPAVVVLQTLSLLGAGTTSQRVGYGTSADVTGDTSRVVGYAGMLFA